MYHGQNNFDEFLFHRYFQCGAPFVNREGGLVVEAGALDGRELSNGLFFEETLEWRAINIEPAQRAFEALQVNRPKALNLRMALDFRESSATFWDAVHPLHGHLSGNGSLDHTAEHRKLLEAEGYTFETYSVQTMRYSCLMTILGQPLVDLMILDVEGGELRTITGMRDAVRLPRVLAVEIDHIGLDPIEAELKKLGYKLDELQHANAVFVLPEEK